MSVPNHSHVPRRLYDTGLFNLKTEDGQGAFTDACVAVLHGLDERWGHLRKTGGATNVHGHGEDSALYLSDEPGQSCAVDFIGGAGGPNPQPGWMVDEPRYSAKDWVDPFDHKLGELPPPPTAVVPGYEAIGGDTFFRASVGVPLEADMALAGQALNNGSSVWFSRTCYDILAAKIQNPQADTAPIALKHRNEWRAILGQPPL